MNYYIQGDAANADKIKAAFEKLGYKTKKFDFMVGFFFTCGKEVYYAIPDEIANIIKTHPDYTELELPIEPKFKAGDDIKTGNTIETIAEVDHTTRSYLCESGRTIWFENQDLWHLVPKKHYDIANFQPFDKVLVRDRNESKWSNTYFGFYDEEQKVFVCDCSEWEQCIPYNDKTEHLLGTTDMPSEEYINW